MDVVLEWLSAPEVGVAMGGMIVAVLGTVTGLFTWINHRLKNVSSQVKATNHQVENDHDTNLRDDLSKALAFVEQNSKQIKDLSEALDSLGRRLDKQHGETHRVLTQETEDRQNLARSAQIEKQRLWSAIDHLRSKH